MQMFAHLLVTSCRWACFFSALRTAHPLRIKFL